MTLQRAALRGSQCGPFPDGTRVAVNEWPSIVPLTFTASRCSVLDQHGTQARGECGGVVDEGGVPAGKHGRLDVERRGERPRAAVAELAGRFGTDTDHDPGLDAAKDGEIGLPASGG